MHQLSDILRARILAIACGYEDADDLDHLRRDPAFKLACGKLPASGRDLCSQPTMSRWENAPSLREIIRMMRAMIGLYCASYAVPPEAVTLDIDDTVDVVHGYQQLSSFNAHYNERCFLPIHIYDTATARPVAVLLRPGKTPSGKEVRRHLRPILPRSRRTPQLLPLSISHVPTRSRRYTARSLHAPDSHRAWYSGSCLNRRLGSPRMLLRAGSKADRAMSDSPINVAEQTRTRRLDPAVGRVPGCAAHVSPTCLRECGDGSAHLALWGLHSQLLLW